MAKVYKNDKSWFEDFRDQFRSLNGQPFSKKVEHFFTYYWRLTLGIIIGIIAIVAIISSIIYNSVPKIIQGVTFPHTIADSAPETLKQALADEMGVDASKYHIDMSAMVVDNASTEQIYAASQAILARIMGNDLDFLCADLVTFTGMVSKDSEDNNVLYNLKELLDAETYAALDKAGRIVTVETTYAGTYPCLVDVQNTRLSELLELSGTENYIGIIINTKRPDAARALIKLIQ